MRHRSRARNAGRRLYGAGGVPVPVAAVVNDDHDLVVTFSAAVLVSDPGGWGFSGGAGGAVPLSANASGDTITFTFDPGTFGAGGAYTAAYDAASGSVTDATGRPVASFSGFPVVNPL